MTTTYDLDGDCRRTDYRQADDPLDVIAYHWRIDPSEIAAGARLDIDCRCKVRPPFTATIDEVAPNGRDTIRVRFDYRQVGGSGRASLTARPTAGAAPEAQPVEQRESLRWGTDRDGNITASI